MSEYYPGPRDQHQIDAGHLKLLAIFHFIGAGLAVFGLLLLFAHYKFMSFIMNNPGMSQNQSQWVSPQEFFALFKVIYLIGGLWFVMSGVLNVMSGIFIRARKHRTFSLVVAGIDCLYLPLGTILGVFTFVVLLRETVGEAYRQTETQKPK